MYRLAFFGFTLIALCPAQDRRTVTEPQVPAACTTISAQLSAPQGQIAEADEQKLDTPRIQTALDQCGARQAVVLKADGAKAAFLSGPLELRSGVTLVIGSGVTLYASRNPRDYDLQQPGVCGTITENGHGCKALINGTNAKDSGVMGPGTIDGRGSLKILGQDISWWDLAERARKGGNQNNPRLMILSHCDNFTLYNLTLKNSPNFHVYYGAGNGFTAWGVKIDTPKKARNTDGIDPGASTNVTIAHCWIRTGDDNVAIKAGSGASTYMTIDHNHFYSGHGMSIGSETNGGANHILVRDLSIDGADNGLRIKSNSSKGGPVRTIVYEDVCIRNTKNPILMDSNYSYYGKDRDKLPSFTGIALRNVRIEGPGTITLDGFDPSHKLGIHFDNVTLANPDAIKLKGTHADVTLGPGPVNFRPQGEDLQVTGTPGGAAPPNACSTKFITFPDVVPDRPAADRD